MTDIKDELLRVIQRRSVAEAGQLAGEFARAAAREKEGIRAALELEQWLAASCDICLQEPAQRPL